MAKKRVLITGAAGRIGSYVAEALAARNALRLPYHRNVPASPPSLDIGFADLSSYEQTAPLLAGMDAVVHLAASPHPREPWDGILNHNIIATYNVYEAARQAGVPKIVFASSNHAMGMYDRDAQWPIYADQPHRPDSLYGVSKAFGEILGRHYADQFGLSVISLRIGWCLPKPKDEIGLWMWLSQRDCAQLIWRAIESPLAHGVFYGVSNNSRRHWDITDAMEKLGYRPVDNSEEYAAEILGS